MSAASHQDQAAADVAQFAYPTSALLSFLALRSICLYNGQSSLPQIDPSCVRRNVLLGLIALIISTYAASSINIFIRVLTHSEQGIDVDKEYYLFFAALVWTFELLFWPRSKEYVWYPYLVSAYICVVGEVIIFESTLSSSLAFTRFDLISFNIQCFRIAALLLLPAIHLGQRLNEGRVFSTTDEERQTLLGGSGETSQRSSIDEAPSQHKCYGSLGKQIAVRDYARSGTDGTKSSTEEIHSTSRNQDTVKRNIPSEGGAERILVIENGQAVAFGTPEDIVRAVSADSSIVPVVANLNISNEAAKKQRKVILITKETAAKNEAAAKSLVTVREAAASINAGKLNTSPAKKTTSRSTTPTRKAPVESVSSSQGAAASAHAHAPATHNHDSKQEITMVTPVTIRQTDANAEGNGKKVDTPITAQKVTDAKPDEKSTPITIRRASATRNYSKSPSKSLQGSTSSFTKLKPDVPEFVPRSLRNSTATEASACSRAHTPVPHSREGTQSREGSRPSSPSKFTVHAPEFIPRHLRTSTDASTSSGPQSPTTGRPVSPLKLHAESASSPTGVKIPTFGSPKPQFNTSINLNDKAPSSDTGYCMRHGRHVLGPATGNAAPTRPVVASTQIGDASFFPSKTHLNRVNRRDMAKSEPTSVSHSQMSNSHDGAQDGARDSENSGSAEGKGKGISAETTVKKGAPKTMQHRRVTAPSDPPSGVESQGYRSVGRKAGRQRRSRHWRIDRKIKSRSGMSSGLASESSMGGSSAGGSYEGGGTRAPVTSPRLGPVPGYASTGFN